MTETLQYLQEAANGGDGNACFRLGTRYERGDGVEKDPARAAYWYEKGAECGDTLSMINLSCMDINGTAGNVNYDRALRYAALASDQETYGQNAAIASLNASLVYRLSEKHRDYDKCVVYCQKAVAQDPDAVDLKEQLVIVSILRECRDDMVAPIFVSQEGKPISSRPEHDMIRDAVIAYGKVAGVKGYRSLFNFFREEAKRVDKSWRVGSKLNSLTAYIQGEGSGAVNCYWTVAAEFRYLIEAKQPFVFGDSGKHAGIHDMAALYAMVGFPDTEHGFDVMKQLALEGYDQAYLFLARHSSVYFEKAWGADPRDFRYKAELVGAPLEATAEKAVKAEEKSASPDRAAIDRYAFLIGMGAEYTAIRAVSGERRAKALDRAREFYGKLNFGALRTLSMARLNEMTLENAILTGTLKSEAEAVGILSRTLSLYESLVFLTSKDAECERAIAVFRLLSLLCAKASFDENALVAAPLDWAELEVLKKALFPFEPDSRDLLTLPIVESSYGLTDQWKRETLSRGLYACRHFDFLHSQPVTYGKEVLLNVNFNGAIIEKLLGSLDANALSEEGKARILAYLYGMGAKLSKRAMPRILALCERSSGGSDSHSAACAFAAYRLYSKGGGIKTDKEKALTYLVKAAELGVRDAAYETALLAAKGKLSGFGIGKADAGRFLTVAAEQGHPDAKKKLLKWK